MQDGVKHHRRGVSRERLPRGGHLVKHGAKRKKISARVEFFPGRLLRRHVSHRPDRGAGAGEMHFRPAVAARGPPLGTLLAGASLAKPKSRIFAWPRLVTKMLAGLMSR